MVLMRTIILLTAVLLPSAFAMPRAGAETDTARIVADPILQKRQQELKQAIAKVRNAVVGVSDGLGVGSGVVVSPDGIVLTASHVVDSPVRRRIQPPEVDRRVTITFPDGSEYPAEVLGKNRNADAAMLRITRQPPDGKPFPFAEMGRSAELYQGQECFAMGNPGGLQHDRPAPVRIGRILSVGHRTIVSDCSIVLGDSGGPLFDMQGRVIGIHSMITSIIIENRHVAIDCFHRDWDRFQDRSRWGRLQAFDNRLIESSFFGVRLKWTDFRAAVLQVVQDSPADKAGLRPGDVIRSINNQRFADRLDLGTLLSEIDDEEEIDVVVERENEPSTLRLTTGHQEEALEEQRERRRRRREGNADPDDVTAMREDEFAVQLSPHRPIGPYEKRAPDQLKLFRPSMQLVKDSVVAIKDGGPTVALGVVMSSDGYIITKASEVRKTIIPECVFSNGQRYRFRIVASDDAYDLMLIKVDASRLPVAVWDTNNRLDLGTLAIVPDARGNPLIPTVVSVETRTQANSSRGFLGVKLAEMNGSQSGILIQSVISGGAAARSGLKAEDIVLSIDGIDMRTVNQMIDKVSHYKPGEEISVRYLRGDQIKTMKIILTPRFTTTDALLEQYRNDGDEPELLGQFASIHSGGFPHVWQHDSDVYPEQCGGPIVGLDGRIIGLNIARADRVVSYAVPSEYVLQVYQALRNRDSGSE